MEAKTKTTEETTRTQKGVQPGKSALRMVDNNEPQAAQRKEAGSTGPEKKVQPEAANRARGWVGSARRVSGGIVSVAVLVVVWWVVGVAGHYPTFILPTPLDVAAKLGRMLSDGSYFQNVWTTVLEAGLGFVAAFVVGTTLGYLVGHSRFLEKILSPYIALTQGLPVVAIAPLLAIWVRNDLAEKIFVVALIVFFPVLVNTIVAVRSIDRSMYEVALISGANRLQTLWYVELPLGLRSLLGGVKLGLTLAITGAVIGEFISASSGLGFLMTLGRGSFDTPLVFVGLVSLGALTILAYSLVTVLEKMLITWE